MTKTVLIVDDHPVFRKGLSLLLKAEKGLRIVGDAGDGHDAIGLVGEDGEVFGRFCGCERRRRSQNKETKDRGKKRHRFGIHGRVSAGKIRGKNRRDAPSV